MRYLLGVGVCGMLGLVLTATAQDKKEPPDLDKIPKAVMDGLKAKFPRPVITKWTRETEAGKVVYDIEFTQDGRKCEADIYEDGSIHNFERAIEAKDLPKAVTDAVEKKYPKATMKTVMEITEVKDRKEALEGYEIELVTADKKDVEVTVAPDGKVLEDSTEEKKKDEKK